MDDKIHICKCIRESSCEWHKSDLISLVSSLWEGELEPIVTTNVQLHTVLPCLGEKVTSEKGFRNQSDLDPSLWSGERYESRRIPK